MTSDGGAGELVDVIEPVRRVVRARCSDPLLVEDLVQETLVRVAEMQRRTPPDILQAYAIRVATNVVADHARQAGRNGRRLHRLMALDPGVTPESSVIDGEETAALAQALGRIDRDHRRLLELHEVDGVDVGAIADIEDVGRSSVSMRLMRARAALRTEFVLAYRKQEIPSHCRAVLMALATGDTRRQLSLDADEHLQTCDTCRELCPAIVERRRAHATAFAAIGATLVGGWRWIVRPFKGHGGRTAVATTAAVAVLATGAFVVVRGSGHSAPTGAGTATSLVVATSVAPEATSATSPTTSAAPPSAPPPVVPVTSAGAAAPSVAVPAGVLVVGASALAEVPAGGLAPLVGQPVVGRGMTVDAVPADEGFWLRIGPGIRIWVRLVGGGESPVSITPELLIDLDGVLRQPDPAAALPPDVADEVAQLGAYVEVSFDAVRVAG